MTLTKHEVAQVVLAAIAYGVALGQASPEGWGDAEGSLQFVAGRLPEELHGLLRGDNQGAVEAYLEGLVASQL